jgi:hypothetical protein
MDDDGARTTGRFGHLPRQDHFNPFFSATTDPFPATSLPLDVAIRLFYKHQIIIPIY